MNKLVKYVNKFTNKMTLTHLLVALLVVTLVVAVVTSQRNQENFSWSSIRRMVAAPKAALASAVEFSKSYTRDNNPMNIWVNKQINILKYQDNGTTTTKDGTWNTKCGMLGNLTGYTPVDLKVESANLMRLGYTNVYTDMSFKKCQAICDFHSINQTSKGQWKGGCAGFNITYAHKRANCEFYSQLSLEYIATRDLSGLKKKLNKKMRQNWNKKAKNTDWRHPRRGWAFRGLNADRAWSTYWPRTEIDQC